MKIYTKTGDTGTTGLYGGERVAKSSPRITAYGEIDELNATIGMVCAFTPHAPISESLSQVQSALFTVGAQLASPKRDARIEIITASHVEFLERQIDVMTTGLPPLKTFI